MEAFMLDSQQVSIQQKHYDTFNLQESLISSDTDALALLNYRTQISTFVLEVFLDRPVIEQSIFLLLINNAMSQMSPHIQAVIKGNPEIASENIINEANNFFINFEYIRQIINHRFSAKNTISSKRFNQIAEETIQSIATIMLPEISVSAMAQGNDHVDLEENMHLRIFSSISLFEKNEQKFLHYKFENRIADIFSKMDFKKNGNYTTIDFCAINAIDQRIDCYLYLLLKSNFYRQEFSFTFGDFQKLQDIGVQMNYIPSALHHKRFKPAVDRLNKNNKIEYQIEYKFTPSTKRGGNGCNYSTYTFKVSLKSKYLQGLNTLKSICSKIVNDSGECVKISENLFMAILRISDGDSTVAEKVLRTKIAEYTIKYGPTHINSDLNLVAQYLRKALEDLYRSAHFFQAYLLKLKHENEELYLADRKRPKPESRESSSVHTDSFSSGFSYIIDQVDNVTKKYLMDVDIWSRKTESLVVVDYKFIRHSIFTTHPYLKLQRTCDEEKYIDLVQECATIAAEFFGSVDGRDSVQTFFSEALFDYFYEDNFCLTSDLLKKIIKSDEDFWRSIPKQKMVCWKKANEFSLKSIT